MKTCVSLWFHPEHFVNDDCQGIEIFKYRGWLYLRVPLPRFDSLFLCFSLLLLNILLGNITRRGF